MRAGRTAARTLFGEPGTTLAARLLGARLLPAKLLGISLLTSAFALFAPAGDSYAQSRIGWLFSGPEQRLELDRLREDARAGEAAEPFPGGSGEEPRPGSRPGPRSGTPALAATLDGVVTRGDGHQVAWIDGVATAIGGPAPAGGRVEAARGADGRFRIRVSFGGVSAVLEPGQSVDANGRVRNAYERRSRADAASPASGNRIERLSRVVDLRSKADAAGATSGRPPPASRTDAGCCSGRASRAGPGRTP